MKRPWLLPFVPLYATANHLRELRLRRGWEPVQHLTWPVVSVGNLSTGGTGKTPFTIALAQLLTAQGFFVDVLSRGYGRQSSTVERVHPNGNPDRFGDEPILIARETNIPVYVAKKRFQAGQSAEQASPLEPRSKPAIHLLDDGFQHRQLARQIDIVLVSSDELTDTLLPAGNLRESLSALKRGTVLAVPTEDEAAIHLLHSLRFGPPANQPIWRFKRKTTIPTLPPHTPIAAFCGIARPAQFFTGLTQAGLNLSARKAFPDHHRFTPSDIDRLLQLVRTSGAKALLTTAKDLIRLGPDAEKLQQTVPLYEVPLKILFEDPESIAQWLKSRLL